jgi:hypothetical protein
VISALALVALGSQTRKPVTAGHELDFWVGRWQVYAGGKLNGTDTVTKSLNGFAITEQWKGTEKGDTGTSLFYYMPVEGRWKQVWVTGVGAYKEKYSEAYPNGVRFSGFAHMPRGKIVGDRTTLTRLTNGDVRQVIEESLDGQKTWQVGFDAIYKRRK